MYGYLKVFQGGPFDFEITRVYCILELSAAENEGEV